MSFKMSSFEWENKIMDDVNTLVNLINFNENTEKYNDISKKILEVLCKIKPGLEVKLNGSKTCRFCFQDFAKDPHIEFPCKCHSFHKNCLLRVCLDISKDLNEEELEKLICGDCRKNISILTVEKILQDDYRKEKRRIEEFKNRKVKCLICSAEEKYDKMFERHCGHGFCKQCFKIFLENLIRKKKGNIREFACPVKNCEISALVFDEIRTFVDKSIMNNYDDYLDKIFDPRKQNNLIFKCKSDDCFEVKVTNCDSKDQEYVCMKCEERKKEPKQEEHKKE